jgi:hypothetical protein
MVSVSEGCVSTSIEAVVALRRLVALLQRFDCSVDGRDAVDRRLVRFACCCDALVEAIVLSERLSKMV